MKHQKLDGDDENKKTDYSLGSFTWFWIVFATAIYIVGKYYFNL